MPNNRGVPGCSDADGYTSGPALHDGSGASGWGMGQQPDDVREVGFISPVGIAWSL